MFCVPLKDRREGEEEQPLSYEDALAELAEIVKLSDDGARSAVNVKNEGSEAERKKWWKNRMDLDERMKTLLENMEFCWLGAFKVLSLGIHSSQNADVQQNRVY
jgi:separase